MTGDGRDGRSVFVTAQDGLRLHVQDYGSRTAPGVPVVCLPGLTRTVSDFAALAPALANDMALPRRVIAIDSRGRGQSDYDSNPDNYNLAVELADVATILTALGVRPAVFIGSSRGGLLTMLMGVAHPTAIAGVVLHDIGPVIELKGLVRLKSYVGKLPPPRSFADGAEILRRLFAAQFPLVTTEGWLAAAHRTWQMKDNELKPTYDVRLARTLADIDIERPLPPLWNEFELACPRAHAGHPRHQFRHPVGRDGRGHGGASSRDAVDRGAGSGPCSRARGRSHRHGGAVRRRLRQHGFASVDSAQRKIPGERSRRGSSNSYLDQAIRAGSRGERER